MSSHSNPTASTTKLPYIRPRTEELITRTQLYSQTLSDDEDDVFSQVSTEDDEDMFSDGDDSINDELGLDTIRRLAKEATDRAEKEKEDEIRLRDQIPRPQLTKEPEVIDDFIRNFLTKHKMMKTLELFQNEWYEKLQQNSNFVQELEKVPDVYVQNVKSEHEISRLNTKLEEVQQKAKKAKEKLDKIKKEKEYHKTHHQRVVQEKKILLKELNRLKQQCEKYDPVIDQLRRKYEKAMKEKMLIRLEKDKLSAKINALEITIQGLESDKNGNTVEKPIAKTSIPKAGSVSFSAKLPTEDRPNPYHSLLRAPIEIDSLSPTDSFEGHTMAISSMALHPKKPIVATVSDDTTWKIWSLPSGKIIMSGDGHKDWVSGCDFHPRGTHLATSSGDGTIKIWDFLNSCCAATLSDHAMAVWAVAHHDTGDFLVSCSMDHTGRLWDLHTAKCRSTLRGHLDSVNHVTFIPYTNNVVSCSADKTVSIWDLRCDTNSVSTSTFYGHNNSCNHVTVDLRGDTLASSDCEGTVILWDLRTMTERMRLEAGPHPANKMAFDASGEVLAVASEDATLKLFNLSPKGEQQEEKELKGHKDGVHDVLFDPEGKFMLTCSSDATVCFWQ